MLNCQQVSSLPSFRSEETGTVKTVRVTNAGLTFHLYVKKRGKQFLKEQNIFHFKHTLVFIMMKPLGLFE